MTFLARGSFSTSTRSRSLQVWPASSLQRQAITPVPKSEWSAPTNLDHASSTRPDLRVTNVASLLRALVGEGSSWRTTLLLMEGAPVGCHGQASWLARVLTRVGQG